MLSFKIQNEQVEVITNHGNRIVMPNAIGPNSQDTEAFSTVFIVLQYIVFVYRY